MSLIFKIEAKIIINNNGGRTLPIKTGYRPGFNFIDSKQTSGVIILKDINELNPGETASVEINFISDMLLGNIKSGSEFKFYEGPFEIGRGMVLKIVGWTMIERNI